MRWTGAPRLLSMRAEAAMPPQRFRLIVFDWDGTLADSTALIASSIREACRDLGVAIPDEAAARYVIGLGLDEALRHVAPAVPPARYPELSIRYRHHFLSRDAHIPLFDGIRGMLAELESRGFFLAIATGKSRRGLMRALEQQGIAGHFVATRCADEGHAKPHPGMLLHLLERLGVAAAETVMIGDTTHDLELARNAGVPALAVSYGAHPREALARHAPLALLDSPLALDEWLRDNA
jgi:phosphoglycolate phosphatase